MDIFKMFGDFSKETFKIEKKLPGFSNQVNLKFEVLNTPVDKRKRKVSKYMTRYSSKIS